MIVTVFFLCLAAGAYYYWRQSKVYVPETVPTEIDSTQLQDYGLLITDDALKLARVNSFISPSSSPFFSPFSTAIRNSESVMSNSLNLRMPFYSQAPFGNWSLPWQEACEEASSLLVANVYQHKNWSREEFNQEILKIVDWEKQNFGAYEHTDVNQTVSMLDEYLDLKSIVHTNPTFEEVKKILNQGHFIIMPLAGKQLKNPFYSNGGPIYHMLVVKGYKENKLITHDVGTKNGENYVYSWEVVKNALHDYAEPIERGSKRIIEVLPPNS